MTTTKDSWYDSSNEFEPIPVGNYAAVVDNITCDLTKSPPSIKVVYKLKNKRKAFQNFKLTGTDGNKKWLTWQMGILGLNTVAKALTADKEEITPADVAMSYVHAGKDLLGKNVELEITHRQHEGKTYDSVKLLAGPDEVTGIGLNDPTDEIPF